MFAFHRLSVVFVLVVSACVICFACLCVGHVACCLFVCVLSVSCICLHCVVSRVWRVACWLF